MSMFKAYRDYTGSSAEKFYKSTLFHSEQLLLGLNCLLPGQEQHVHTHTGQDKFYFVVEGHGAFSVGDELREAGEGMVVWAPADVPHGVTNTGEELLVLLIGIAPAPGK